MTSNFSYLVSLIVIAVILDLIFVTGRIRLRKLKAGNAKTRDLDRWQLWRRAYQPKFLLVEWKNNLVKFRNNPKIFTPFLELTLLAVWALFLSPAYLNLNPNIVPVGHGFGSTIPSHYFWVEFKSCGVCALWNGSQYGGYPALAELFGGILHPITAITTLLWGVINGVKLSIPVILWSAGLGQWWLARELKLGQIPRMWSACIAMAGGHLSGRMELGLIGILLSTAAASLVLAGIVHVYNQRTSRSSILLGVTGGLLLVSGQGYLQIGLIAILPGMLFLLIGKDWKVSPHWKHYLLAACLGLLLAAPLLVPLLHFGGNIQKDTDSEFGTAQPLKYFVLNLVIDDVDYLYTPALKKPPFPYLYTLFIGWIPVILAIYGITQVKKAHRAIFGFFIASIVLTFLIASAELIKPLTGWFPALAGIRHPSLIAGLAVPLILALSAYGLDRLLSSPWPILSERPAHRSKNKYWSLSTQWILLIPVLFSLRSVYLYTRHWLIIEHKDENVTELLEGLKTESTQWVSQPWGEHFFVDSALDMGLKLSPGIVPWYRTENREGPLPYLIMNRGSIQTDKLEFIKQSGDFYFYKDKTAEYAAIFTNDRMIPCTATGSGGSLTVHCQSDVGGTLVVKEYMWSGWRSWVDGQAIKLDRHKTWLEVSATAGDHTYKFRYLPWDVLLGTLLWLCGTAACVYIWAGNPRMAFFEE